VSAAKLGRRWHQPPQGDEMGDVRAFSRDWPEVLIRIETSANLDLGNVGRLFQRINTGARRAYLGAAPRIEIVSVETGSVMLRIAALSAVLTAGQLALQIGDHLQNDPAASRVCRDAFDNDHVNRILIIGDQQRITVTPEDVGDYESAAFGIARSERAPAPPRQVATTAEGVFEGTIERISGEYYIQLTLRPGLFLRIEEHREQPDILAEHQRYRVEGTAYFAPIGKPSAFMLRNALRL
jgi:hypothetical protein